MRRTRVLLVEMPRMLGDIITTLTKVLGDQPDLEVVGRTDERSRLPGLATASMPDVVLVELGEKELPLACVEWFRAHPSVRVLAVASEGRDLTELRCVRSDVSPNELLNAIRDVARSR